MSIVSLKMLRRTAMCLMVLASTVRLTGAEAQMPATLTTPPPPAYTLNVSGQYNQEPYGADVTPFEINYVVNVTGAAGTPTGAVTFWNGSGLACPTVSTEAPDQISGAVPPATPDLFYDQLTQSGTPASVGGTSSPLLDKNGNATFQVGCVPGTGSTVYTGQGLVDSPISLVAVYNGDTTYAGSISQPLVFNILPNPEVLVTSDPSSLTVANGSSVTATISVASVLGYGAAGLLSNVNGTNYTFPLGLSCDGLPAYATCVFSLPQFNCPTSISNEPTPSTDPAPGILCVSAGTYSTQNPIALGTPNTIQVTIFTNVGVGAVNSSSLSPRRTTAFAALFGAGLLGLLTSRKRKALRGQLLAVVCALVLSGSVLGLSACSTANLTPSGQTISPKGTYQVNIVARETGTLYVPNTSGGGNIPLGGNGRQMSIPDAIPLTVQ